MTKSGSKTSRNVPARGQATQTSQPGTKPPESIAKPAAERPRQGASRLDADPARGTREFTRRPTPAELKNLVHDIGLDVPVYATRVVGNRLELHCYGGLLVTIGGDLGDKPRFELMTVLHTLEGPAPSAVEGTP